MARKNLIRTEEYPYHITTRSNNGDWFQVQGEEIWEEFQRLLEEGIKKFKISPHCFTLMSNHYHLLVSTPHENIDEFMMYFNRHLSLFIGERAGRINRIFGGRYKWTVVSHQKYYGHVYRYIYQNPLRAGICKSVEEYPFTSFKTSLDFPLLRKEIRSNLSYFIPFHFQGQEGLSYYVNKEFKDHEVEWMRKGLRGTDFSIPKNNSSRRMINFEEII